MKKQFISATVQQCDCFKLKYLQLEEQHPTLLAETDFKLGVLSPLLVKAGLDTVHSIIHNRSNFLDIDQIKMYRYLGNWKGHEYNSIM